MIFDSILLAAFIIVWLPLTIFAVTGLGHVTMGPLREACETFRAPARFLLSDFVWLMVLLQFWFALLTPLLRHGEADVAVRVLIVAFVAGVTTLAWAGAVDSLSRAGVRSTPRRALFILVILPGLVVILMATGMAMLMVPVGVRLSFAGEEWTTLTIGLAAAAVSSLGAWLLRLGVGWVAGGTTASWGVPTSQDHKANK